jgi:hypothetical protein
LCIPSSDEDRANKPCAECSRGDAGVVAVRDDSANLGIGGILGPADEWDRGKTRVDN